ncbi:MAG: folylpolyglutamate synthase/dihydrofolate synthase family protein [Gemmatimonadota bacterium]
MLSSAASRRARASAAESRSEIERLLDRPLGHIRWGLGRISRMLASLGDPQGTFEVFHIGGTNGKGSVAAIAEAVIGRQGLAGLYTSPHLSDFAERIRIAGRPVSAELLERCAGRVRPLVEREGATYFEAATALAFLAFGEAGVRDAVVEVGLGGRLDATNVVDPRVCAIASVGLDHQEYLGDTLGEVAAEKAGILKPGVPAALGTLPGEAARVVLARARVLGSKTLVLGRDVRIDDVSVDASGTTFTYACPALPGGVLLRVPLLGGHQASNAAVAFMMLELAGRLPAAKDLRGALKEVCWPGRFERLPGGDGDWILDVAHNPDAARALADTLRRVDPVRPLVFVIAVLRRKAWREMLRILAGPAHAIVLTTAPSHPPGAAWNLDEAARFGRSAAGADAPIVAGRRPPTGPRVEVVARLEAALVRARELAGNGTVVVAGSCHVVGDARGILALDDRGARNVTRRSSSTAF